MVLLKQRMVYARLVVHSVDVGLRYEAHKVVVAHEIHGVKAEVELRLRLVALKVAAVGYVRLAPKDGLYPWQALEVLLRGPARIVERLQREQVAVIRDGERRHPPLAGLLHKRVDLALPIQQRVGGMKVKMYEVAHVTSPRS